MPLVDARRWGTTSGAPSWWSSTTSATTRWKSGRNSGGWQRTFLQPIPPRPLPPGQGTIDQAVHPVPVVPEEGLMPNSLPVIGGGLEGRRERPDFGVLNDSGVGSEGSRLWPSLQRRRGTSPTAGRKRTYWLRSALSAAGSAIARRSRPWCSSGSGAGRNGNRLEAQPRSLCAATPSTSRW